MISSERKLKEEKSHEFELQKKDELVLGSSKAWLILGCGWLFYLYEYILRVSPSVFTKNLMIDFSVTSASLGFLVFQYYLAYVPLQIPCGVIVDRFGPRKIITISALLCAVGCFLFGNSADLMDAKIGRFLIGAGSACAYISCMKITSSWFLPSSFALISGISMAMGTLGGTFGGSPFALLTNSFGWRSSMIYAGFVGVIVSIIAWLVIRERRETASATQIKLSNVSEKGLIEGLKIIVKNPQNWLIGLYGCVMYLPISAFAELWGVPFLMEKYGIDNKTAAVSSIMIFVGMALGSIAGAWLSERIQSRKKVMSLAVLGTLIFFVMAIYLNNISLNFMFTLLFLGGLFSGGQILYFAAAKEINPAQTSGTTIGFINCLVMVSGLVFQPLLGHLIDYSWSGQFRDDGSPLYLIDDYKFALSAMVLALLVGLLILRFVKETFDAENK